MENLLELLGLAKPRIDSQGQLDEMAKQTYSKEAENDARRRGFPSAEAMLNWQRQQEVRSGQHGQTRDGVGQQILDHPMHPKNMLDYVLRAMQGNN